MAKSIKKLDVASIKKRIETINESIRYLKEERATLQAELLECFTKEQIEKKTPLMVGDIRISLKPSSRRIVWDQAKLALLYSREDATYKNYIKVTYSVDDRVLKKTPDKIKEVLKSAKSHKFGDVVPFIDYDPQVKL